MKRLLLPAAMTALGVIPACSSGSGPNAGPASSEAATDAQSVAPAVMDSLGLSSNVKTIAFDAASTLPRAPASARSQADCAGAVREPVSAAARDVAGAGWGVTGEGTIGAYQVISFAGSFEPGTSGSCYVGKGNLAVFEGGKLRAIAYARSGSETTIGHIEPFGNGDLRIWDGELLPQPIADLRRTEQGLAIGKLSRQERTCGGVVPAINERPITQARKALIASGWRPVDHGAPEDRADRREKDLATLGVIEVESCSGTGFGYCSFDYERAGAALSVTTAGDNEDPSVSDYAVKCRS